jgi:hypothetical protein
MALEFAGGAASRCTVRERKRRLVAGARRRRTDAPPLGGVDRRAGRRFAKSFKDGIVDLAYESEPFWWGIGVPFDEAHRSVKVIRRWIEIRPAHAGRYILVRLGYLTGVRFISMCGHIGANV